MAYNDELVEARSAGADINIDIIEKDKQPIVMWTSQIPVNNHASTPAIKQASQPASENFFDKPASFDQDPFGLSEYAISELLKQPNWINGLNTQVHFSLKKLVVGKFFLNYWYSDSN